MTESEVRKLFLVIQNSYNGFSYDDLKVAVWLDLLQEVPFSLAQKNLRAHIMDYSRPFPPAPGELARPEHEQDQLALYHDSLRDSAREHMANMDEWIKTATPPPPHVKEAIRRLRDGL